MRFGDHEFPKNGTRFNINQWKQLEWGPSRNRGGRRVKRVKRMHRKGEEEKVVPKECGWCECE